MLTFVGLAHMVDATQHAGVGGDNIRFKKTVASQ